MENGWFYPICQACEDECRRWLHKKIRMHGGPRLEQLLDERLSVLASEFPWSEGDAAKRRRIS